jgi:parallel beta-helix repeat protein
VGVLGTGEVTQIFLQNLKLEVGISLESSGDNLIQGNDFANCSTGVSSVISGGNRFSGNRVKATQLFLDLRLSSQNEIVENSFEGEEGIYAERKHRATIYTYSPDSI